MGNLNLAGIVRGFGNQWTEEEAQRQSMGRLRTVRGNRWKYGAHSEGTLSKTFNGKTEQCQ
jgi:hypothetical protein